ncbi:MAG: STAS domain-containing protein [Bacteroidales bacterium]|nr:STAS domain-containing protein [Bacteroidales bacterium]
MAEYYYNEHSHTQTCKFNGKLDTDISNKLQPEIEEKIIRHFVPQSESRLRVVFDFADVEFVTSAFIRLCVLYAKKIGKENFSIINSNPFIKKIFKIAGLDGELNLI